MRRYSTRFALVGLAALAGLSAVQWARTQGVATTGAFGTFIGFAPNLFAAIAITFVLLGAMSDQRKAIDRRWVRERFILSASVAGAGLIGWEFIQRTSPRFRFDVADIAATLLGLCVAGVAFWVIAPRSDDPL